jgi:hypothetical protein
LRGHAGERDGRDVELLIFDEREQKVERPVEGFDPDGEGGLGGYDDTR